MEYQQETTCDCSSNAYSCANNAYLDGMFWIAKKARMELIKEKMKKAWEQKEGKKFEEAVNLIVETLIAHNQTTEQNEEAWNQFHKKFDSIWRQ